ncbi:MAG TPA: urea carboxylase-associated family protein, partial [Dongiaceae bacterium]|nr:urea carboxylase-associated family protein [Dongiaceae bacterium]
MNLPAPRLRFREPGLPRLDPGIERYRLAGLGGLILHLFAGDRVEIVDREGRQACAVAAFGDDGRPAFDALGLKPDGDASGINRVLKGEGENGPAIARTLRARNIPPRIDRAAILLGGDGRAGQSAILQAQRDLDLVLHAPGPERVTDGELPATDLSVIVHRARVTPLIAPPLPEPLGDLVAEYHVPRCTAISYAVKEGQYIQVIDAEGRQCSDFLAFDARRLQGGVERGLDMTTTRTLLGMVYPGPGLASKFFDTDMQPLVEVVQDTVGRHDTFGLACTNRFYEDAGYPGHPSCSDNFNKALEGYGLARRPGWQAVNLFYNTGISAANAIFLDDPWSRPGDYVLMRAMKDLVCGSSACPDDID